MLKKNELGLTLIELLAVIIILAIIAAIAIPSIANVISNQRDNAIIADVVNLLEASKFQMSDNECEDDICTYSPSLNEISFYSSKFTTAEVDFTLGNKRDEIFIKVELDESIFKGKKADTYKALFTKRADRTFTEEELLDAMNQ